MQGATLAQIQNFGYSRAFDIYVDTLRSKNPEALSAIGIDPAYEHNYMANHLLDFFANSLEEYDDNRLNDPEYYWRLSWLGLMQSQAWVDHWPSYNTYPNPGWQIIANPALNNNDKQGFKYALTYDRLADIHNSGFQEQEAGPDARGRKPVPAGSNGCYQ